MKNLLLIPLIFVFSINLSAQSKRPAVRPTPKPAAPTVKDVRKVDSSPSKKVVVEKTNGDRLSGLFISGDSNSVILDISGSKLKIELDEIVVLRFGEDPKPTQAPEPKKESLLSIEAALVYQSGDVVPVSRTTFYLLDDSVVSILKAAMLSCLIRSELPTIL